MYVDKTLSGIKAVQTLSRLNRAHPQEARRLRARLHERRRHDPATPSPTTTAPRSSARRPTQQAARPEGGPGRLPGLRRRSRSTTWWSCISAAPTATSSTRSSTPAWRSTRSELDEDGQVDFKGKAKAFARTYGFLASILPYTNADWEKLSIFLNFLVPKLPAPKEEDLSKGILEAIDMDSYRVEKQAAHEDRPARRGRRDRARADQRRRPQAGARAGPAVATSSRRSTTSSATSPGRTPTASASSSPRRSRPRWRRTRPTRTPRRTPTSRTPASSTTRRCVRVMIDRAEGRHRAVQAVQRQPSLQKVAERHDLPEHVPGESSLRRSAT